MPFLRMLWSLSLCLTNALQFTGPNQINADDEDDDDFVTISAELHTGMLGQYHAIKTCV